MNPKPLKETDVRAAAAGPKCRYGLKSIVTLRHCYSKVNQIEAFCSLPLAGCLLPLVKLLGVKPR